MTINISKFVKSNTGKYVVSILLGLGLATIFREVCKDNECIIFNAPDLNEVENKIYKQDGKCYKYNLVSTKCNNTKKDVLITPNSS
jgi:hypothetical protein